MTTKNRIKRQISFLTRDEIKKIINTCDDSFHGRRDRAIMETLFSTGMRIHEALKVKVADIVNDPKEMTIIGKGGWQRVIYFSPIARKAIKDYMDKHYDIGEVLFPITPRAVQLMLKKRAVMAGITKRVSPHVFRHSLATDLLRQGVDIALVSKFLGHRNITNTMIYTHVVNDQLKKVHEKIYK